MKFTGDSTPIFHLNLEAKRCWIHSGHCAASGVKYLPLLGGTLANEEHGAGKALSQSALICLVIGNKLQYGNSFNHSY